MDNIVLTRPPQRVSDKKKNTKAWKENNTNYWIGRCNTTFFNLKELLVLYKAAAGILDEADYTYITNPFATDNPKLKGYPSRMRNIDIISPVLNTLWGELSDRYFKPQVVCLNEDIVNKKLQEDYQVTLDYLKQEFVNGLVAKGLAPEEIAKQQLPEDLERKLKSNVKLEYSKLGQNSLEYIRQFNEVDKIRRKTFYDRMVCSRHFTFRDILNEDTEYNWISPFELSYVSSPNIDAIEDSEAVTRTTKMSIPQVIDKFKGMDGFTKEIIDELEINISSVTMPDDIAPRIAEGQVLLSKLFNSNPSSTSINGILVQHVNWTSMKCMYHVTGKNEITGEPYSYEVDEDYIFSENEEWEEYWINEKWQAYRINSKYVVGAEAIPYQRGTMNNPSKCKNQYNGGIFGNNYIIPQSHVEKGLVYQIKYNIVHYLMEKVMAKNKDKLTILPLGLVPEKEGMDMFKMMYYGDAHGFLFIDETNEKAMSALQYVKVLDMGLSTYIEQAYKMLNNIKEDWKESVGVNRQRMGNSFASDGKAVTEEAIHRGSIISEEFFMQHEELIMKDLQCLLDLSKVAWQNGKKANFMSSDFKLVDLKIDPTVYQNLDMAIFAKNSGDERRKVDSFRSIIGTIAQNTNNFSILGRILDADNMAKLIEDMDELEAKIEQNTQAQQQAENNIEIAKEEGKEKDRQLKIYEIDEDNKTEHEGDLIDAQTKLFLGSKFSDGDLDNDGELDVTEIAKLDEGRRQHYDKLQLERETLRKQNNIDKEKLKVEREKMANDLKIAKMRPKPSK